MTNKEKMEVLHSGMVMSLVKPGEDILKQMTPAKANLMHMAVGISGEAGELLDSVKKFVIYNKPLDMANVIEELGDLEFFLEGIRQALDISRTDTLDHNYKKLGERYEGHQYSDEQAQARKDKTKEP